MSKNKFFSVNMNTTEEAKPVDPNNIMSNNDDNSNSSTVTFKGRNEGRIKFNQADIEAKKRLEHKVTRVEDPDELFGKKDEKMTKQDMKMVLVPTIGLILFSIINEIFIVPIVIENTVKYVLKGEITLSNSLTISNEQMIKYAGLILIIAYVLFSIALIGFGIFNLAKRAFAQKDLAGVAAKIILYTFLIGFIVVVVDCVIPADISEYVVKISTFGLHSIVKYLK